MARAQHGHQHHAQRRKSGEIAHQIRQHIAEPFPAQQALHRHMSHFPVGRQTKEAAKKGRQNHRQGQNGKQGNGMRQTIPHLFHTV